MKLITLNTWGGRLMEPLKSFLEQSSDVDIFCFQEVYHEASGKENFWKDNSNHNLLNDLKKLLSNHNYIFHSHLEDWWGLAIFVKKDLKTLDYGECYVHKEKGHNLEMEIRGHTAKNIQFIKIICNEKPITILNIHGLWNGQGKTDTEDRIKQSRNIIDFIKNIKEEWVFCGDFNLLPNTKSIEMIENELNCRNLIKEYGVMSTRTSLYKKPEKMADYIFVSKGIKINEFKVLPDEVSDHSPILLDFNI